MPRLHHRPVVSHHTQLEAFTLCNINELLIISDRRAVQEMCVQIANRSVCQALQMMLTYTTIVLYICLSPLCSWFHIWDWDRRLISSPASSSYPPSKDNRKWGLLAAGILQTHTASNLRTELPSSTRVPCPIACCFRDAVFGTLQAHKHRYYTRWNRGGGSTQKITG